MALAKNLNSPLSTIKFSDKVLILIFSTNTENKRMTLDEPNDVVVLI